MNVVDFKIGREGEMLSWNLGQHTGTMPLMELNSLYRYQLKPFSSDLRLLFPRGSSTGQKHPHHLDILPGQLVFGVGEPRESRLLP